MNLNPNSFTITPNKLLPGLWFFLIFSNKCSDLSFSGGGGRSSKLNVFLELIKTDTQLIEKNRIGLL